MVMFVRTNTDLTDFNVGSVIRTILEAAALEDDEQYFQMVQLLQAFSIATAVGLDLDERLADFDILRLEATAASGTITVQDDNLVRSTLAVGANVGAGTITLVDSSAFPATGTIRLDEDGAGEEDVQYTANNTGTGVLTISGATPVAQPHLAGAAVNHVSGAANVTLSAGITARAPATSTEEEVTVATTAIGTLRNGDYDSDPITAVVAVPGTDGNVQAGSITEFVVLPFGGASVTNAQFSGGTERETDAEFRERGALRIQSLSRATVASLEGDAIGVTSGDFQVLFSKIIEWFDPDRELVELRIWPGTNNAFQNNTTDIQNEVLTESADDGQRFFRLAQYPVEEDTLLLYRNGVLIEVDVDFAFNEGTGWIQILGGGLAELDRLEAGLLGSPLPGYSYYTGLIAAVHRVMDGDPNDRTTFPGVRAAGVKLLVLPVVTRTIPVVALAISTLPGFFEENVGPLVVDVVTNYILGLGIGDDVIVAEVIEQAMGVDGMFDVTVDINGGASNITIQQDEVVNPDNLNITTN